MKCWLAASVLVAFASATLPARADCNQFKWSVSRELAWLSANPAPIPDDGRVPSFEKGYLVTLAKLDAKKFEIQPDRAPAANSYTAVLKLPAVEKAGLFQITLSDEAWIDVIQNGKSVRSSDFSGQKDCPGVRKTVRFPLEKGEATIQLRNSQKTSLKLAVRPAE